MSFLENLNFPIIFETVRLSSKKFEQMIKNKMNETIFEQLVLALSVGKWEEIIFYNFPSLLTVTYIEKTIHIAKYRCSIGHQKKKKKSTKNGQWTITFWGEFFKNFFPNLINN